MFILHTLPHLTTYPLSTNPPFLPDHSTYNQPAIILEVGTLGHILLTVLTSRELVSLLAPVVGKT